MYIRGVQEKLNEYAVHCKKNEAKSDYKKTYAAQNTTTSTIWSDYCEILTYLSRSLWEQLVFVEYTKQAHLQIVFGSVVDIVLYPFSECVSAHSKLHYFFQRM